MKFHEHPLRIMRYSMKNLWLLIFPLLRGVTVLNFNPAGIYAWIKGAWIDIVILGVIMIYGFVRWYFSEIILTDSALIHKQGIFVRIKRQIPFECISSAATETLFFLTPFKVTGIRCDTRAGFRKSTDLRLLVSREKSELIMSRLPDVNEKKAVKDIPSPNLASILLFSVFFSSGFSGVVYIAAFFFKGGDIAQDIVRTALEKVTEQAEIIYSGLLSGIPKAAAMAAILFMAAWLFSFVKNLLMYSVFRVSADRDCINVSFGLIKRRRHRIRTEHINYIDIRQNLIMKIFRAASVNISCAGFGYDSHLPVIMPISREKKEDSHNQADKSIKVYRPAPTSFMSYTWLPVCGIVFTALVYNFSDLLPWDISELSFFLAVMSYIPLVWLVMVKIAALFTSGIIISGDNITVRCNVGTRFHTVTAKKDNAVMVHIRQNIIQRLFRKCTVVIFFCGESSSPYKVKAIRLSHGMEIASLLKSDKCHCESDE